MNTLVTPRPYKQMLEKNNSASCKVCFTAPYPPQNKHMKFLSLALFAALAFVQVAGAQTAVRQKQFNLSKKGLAIEGYDPVAYFTEQKAVKGNSALAVFDEGVLYHFATEANKQLFLKNPRQYQPQYGGWCAYAMGDSGEKVEIDPETFKIVAGKLYLFYHSWTNNTLTKWNKNESKLKANADANWAKLFQ